MVGKKVVMAVTGVILVGFVIAHMLGNLKIFLGEEAIRRLCGRSSATMGEPLLPYGALLWTARIILLVSVVLHIVAAVELTLMNRAARPQGYDTKQSIADDLRCPDHALERRDPGPLHRLPPASPDGRVGRLQARSSSSTSRSTTTWWPASRSGTCPLFYILAMAALCLHLDHGVWSMFQTLGLNNARISPVLRMMSRGVAILVFAGFISVPVAVLAGWIR